MPDKQITKDTLLNMIEQDLFNRILHNVHCGNCGITTITGYEDAIFLNERGNTILRGKCITCDASVTRYLETGDSN